MPRSATVRSQDSESSETSPRIRADMQCPEPRLAQRQFTLEHTPSAPLSPRGQIRNCLDLEVSLRHLKLFEWQWTNSSPKLL